MTAHLPPHIQVWLDRVQPLIAADPRFVGLAAGGSWLRGELDGWSDLDLVVAVDAASHADVMAARPAIAAKWGPLLASFTGEHVGEPRLLVCLYDDPVVHVDLKFVLPEETSERVEDPDVLWEREGALTAALARGEARWPAPEPQWIEDRIWTWIHYAACKLGRGELFETLAGLGWLRSKALVPLAMRTSGHDPQGVRRVEQRVPERHAALAATVAGLDAAGCGEALRAVVACYRDLRAGVRTNPAAEDAAVGFLEEVIAGLGRG